MINNKSPFIASSWSNTYLLVFQVVFLTSLTAYVFMGLCLQVKFRHCFQVTRLSSKLISWYLFLHSVIYVPRPQIILSEDKDSSIQSIQKPLQIFVLSFTTHLFLTTPLTTLGQWQDSSDSSSFVGNVRATKEWNALKVCPVSGNVLYPSLSDPNIRNGMKLICAINGYTAGSNYFLTSEILSYCE